MKKCKICGNKNNNKMFKAKEMMFGYRDIFCYFECSKCGCLQIYEIPIEMSKYYPLEYYSFNKLNTSGLDKIIGILAQKRNKYALTGDGILGLILNKLYPSSGLEFLKKAHISMDSRILDVGCGEGYLLKLLGEIGFRRLKGVDPYIQNDIKYKNGIKIVKKQISDLNEEFDLIMFNHSFEHIQNPKLTLESVYRLLSEHGKCIIRLPTVSSYAWKKYNINWVQLDAPRHFFLYSLDSIKILSSNSGFILKEYYYDSTELQFWGSEQYMRDIPLMSSKSYGENPKNSIFSKKEIKKFKKMAIGLNNKKEGDQVVLYLEKIK